MTYAWPTWGSVTDTHPMKLWYLQNRVLCIIGKFPMNAVICNMHTAKLCRQQAQVIQNNENTLFAIS
jgi:hypothetical protein